MQVEDVVEPSKELERADSLTGEATTEPVNQVIELMETGTTLCPRLLVV